MATKFPLILNGVRFQVNPTNLTIKSAITLGELPTQNGIRYQIWFSTPQVLTINGTSAGDTAYRELLFLKENFEQTSSTAMSELFYKTKKYKGFIKNLDVGHSLDAHLRFPYTITFQLLQGERFNIQDFSLSTVGAISNALAPLTNVINEPISRFENSLNNVFGKLI